MIEGLHWFAGVILFLIYKYILIVDKTRPIGQNVLIETAFSP